MVFTCHLGAIFRERLQLRAWKVPAKEREREREKVCVRACVRVGTNSTRQLLTRVTQPRSNIAHVRYLGEIHGHFSARLLDAALCAAVLLTPEILRRVLTQRNRRLRAIEFEIVHHSPDANKI